MTTEHHPVPLQLALPGGIVADYVPGSDPPSYTVAGDPIAVDVRIPDDLTATGWYWHGSFLVQPYPGRAGPAIWISTGTWGVEGTWEQARTLDRLHAEHAAVRAEQPTKKPKRAKKGQPARQRVVEPVQLAMEF